MANVMHSVIINAPAEKIWDVLWNEDSYKEWTQFFSPGSNYKSDWKVGGKTYFLDASGKNGSIATIDRMDKPNMVIFKHIGELHNGKAINNTRKVIDWLGSFEKYFIMSFDGYCKLQGESITSPEYADHIKEGFVKGFAKVKELAEQ